MKVRATIFASILTLLTITSACRAGDVRTARTTPLQPTYEAFQARLNHSRKQLPQIIAAAEAVAARLVAHPEMLIDVAYWPQQSFAEDILNRSGGLALALPTVERPNEATPHDVVLFSMRSWHGANQHEIDKRVALLREYQAKNLMVILFASRLGMPDDIRPNILIDNGATSPGEDQATVNALANVLNAWLWTCEFAAAMTRHGLAVAILKSGAMPGAEQHNKPIQSREGRHSIYPCDTPVPAGELASIYLHHVDSMMAELASTRIQHQISQAADIISKHLNSGGKVGVASISHFLLAEIFLDNNSPWHPFNVVWQTKNDVFRKNLQPDDLLLWIGFIGISTPYENYLTPMRECGASVVTSVLEDICNLQNNLPEAVASIDQSWTYGDSVVPIPYPPGRMAPISGLNQGLIYRMLDDAVVSRLQAMRKN